MKLDIHDLRIGNYLYNDGVIVKIDARTIFDIWDNNGLKKYKPIPLTTHLLEKCGITKKKNSEYTIDTYDFCGYNLWYTEDETLRETLEYYDKKIFLFDDKIKIEFLHDLQNLHRDLRKTNLEITL
jgi:hypothetical protein